MFPSSLVPKPFTAQKNAETSSWQAERSQTFMPILTKSNRFKWLTVDGVSFFNQGFALAHDILLLLRSLPMMVGKTCAKGICARMWFKAFTTFKDHSPCAVSFKQGTCSQRCQSCEHHLGPWCSGPWPASFCATGAAHVTLTLIYQGTQIAPLTSAETSRPRDGTARFWNPGTCQNRKLGVLSMPFS